MPSRFVSSLVACVFLLLFSLCFKILPQALGSSSAITQADLAEGKPRREAHGAALGEDLAEAG